MELRLLDRKFVPIAVIDIFSSLIWTDRYYEYGDFELKIPAGYLPEGFDLGTYLSYDKSEHIMCVENIQIDRSGDDGNIVTASGRSLESILLRRVVYERIYFKSSAGKGLEYFAELLLKNAVIAPKLEYRRIDGFIFRKSGATDIENAEVEAECQGATLYDTINALCTSRAIGFKLTLDSGNIVFQLYKGVDRSVGNKAANRFVVFSEQMNNVSGVQFIQATDNYANAALVMGGEENAQGKVCVDVDFDPTVVPKGLERREIAVDSGARKTTTDENGNEITLTDEQYATLLKNAGREELSYHTVTQSANCEMDSQTGQFVYGRDFKMGDVISIDAGLSVNTPSRVVETTFSTDSGGYSCYQTFESV